MATDDKKPGIDDGDDEDGKPTPRINTGTYQAFRDDALEAVKVLQANRAALDARKTGLAASLITQLEKMADDFAVYEPSADRRAERVSRFYELQEQVADYLAGDR